MNRAWHPTYGRQSCFQARQLVFQDLGRQTQNELSQCNQTKCIRRRLFFLLLKIGQSFGIEGAQTRVQRGQAIKRVNASNQCVPNRVRSFQCLD